MALVFVSYSRNDLEFVQGLVNDLRKHDIPLWFDQDNIPPGARWDVAIEHALEDASHVLLVLSKSGETEEVLRLLAIGLSNREIAEALFVTLGTVKKHLNNIFGKLQVKNRTEAVARARELQILD